MGKEGNTIGYTSWGNLIFTPENLEGACKLTILITIGKAPWVHGIAFKEYRLIGPDETASNFVQLRHLVTTAHTHHHPQSAMIAFIVVSPSQGRKAFVYEHARVTLSQFSLISTAKE